MSIVFILWEIVDFGDSLAFIKIVNLSGSIGLREIGDLDGSVGLWSIGDLREIRVSGGSFGLNNFS